MSNLACFAELILDAQREALEQGNVVVAEYLEGLDNTRAAVMDAIEIARDEGTAPLVTGLLREALRYTR